MSGFFAGSARRFKSHVGVVQSESQGRFGGGATAKCWRRKALGDDPNSWGGRFRVREERHFADPRNIAPLKTPGASGVLDEMARTQFREVELLPPGAGHVSPLASESLVVPCESGACLD